jgi:hypothetical protein
MTPLSTIAPNEILAATRLALRYRLALTPDLRAEILARIESARPEPSARDLPAALEEHALTLRYRLMADAITQGVTRGKLARDHGRELLAELHRYANDGAPIEHWHEDMVERRLMLPGRGQQRRRAAA